MISGGAATCGQFVAKVNKKRQTKTKLTENRKKVCVCHLVSLVLATNLTVFYSTDVADGCEL